MTDRKDRAARQPGEDTVSAGKFWTVAALIVVVVIVIVVVTVRWIGGERDSRLTELNDRYVEKIEIRSSQVGGTTRDVVFVDGLARYDCEEDGGRLTCTDDPQPTEE